MTTSTDRDITPNTEKKDVREKQYCPLCGKECFGTSGDAKKALRNIKRRTGMSGSFYLCSDCHTWHISHHTFRKSKAIKTMKKKNIHTLTE